MGPGIPQSGKHCAPQRKKFNESQLQTRNNRHTINLMSHPNMRCSLPEVNHVAVSFEFKQDVQTVYETLTEPQFLVDRCLALGELSAECEVEEDQDNTTVSLVREVSRDLPRVLAKLFDAVQVTDMTEHWQAAKEGWRGKWTLDVRGQPVTVSASFELVPVKNGCRYTVSHRAKAKIPLLGKQVEKYILGQTTDGATDELQYLSDYLAT